MSLPIKIALVGRANVGKSTLFNCFTQTQSAVVYDMPGVTRDCKVEDVFYGGYEFTLTDTPGIDIHEDRMLKKHIKSRIEETIQESDQIWFMVDGTCGLVGQDQEIVRILRKSGKQVLVLANKADHKNFDHMSFYELGFDQVIPISAAHQMGITNILEYVPQIDEKTEKQERCDKISVLGRPNAGKSTFINTVLGKDYQLTGDMPGITRESVSFPFSWNNQNYELIDTAGIRRKQKVTEELERLSVKTSIDSLKLTQGIIYLIDATLLSGYGIDQQDFLLIHRIIEEGRCLVIGLSKWDEIKDPEQTLEEVRYTLDRKGFHFIPLVTLSSYEKKGIDEIFDKLQESLTAWDTRISTGKLNQWLQRVIHKNPPPSVKGRNVKFKFISQVKTRPPRIFLSTNIDHGSLDSYKRFLQNQFYEEFGFKGVPIRLFFRTSKNPYVKAKA